MSNKQDLKENEPSLEEWMSKIREKKLRPVVVNKEKKVAPAVEKERTNALQEAGDLIKLRQGLRSVSAPKWPGANDSKARTNTTTLPQRAQLRSVSGRTIPAAAPAVLQDISIDKAEPSVDPTSNQSAKPSVTTKTDAQQNTGSEEVISDGWIDVANQVVPTDVAGDEEFPLDSIVAKEKEQKQEAPQPSASSGTTDLVDSIQFKLPTNDDAFPLDVIDDKVGEISTEEEVPPSLTISAGVYVPQDAEDITLKLPKAKDEDFPLDSVKAVPSHEADLATDTEQADQVAPSAGVFDTSVAKPELTLPNKKQDPPTDVTVEDRNAQENADEGEASEVQSTPEQETSQPSTGALDTRPTGNTRQVLAEFVHPQSEKEPLAREQDREPESNFEPEAIPVIKCSQCAAALDLESMGDHVCSVETLE